MKKLVTVLSVVFVLSLLIGHYTFIQGEGIQKKDKVIKKAVDDPTVYVKEGGKKYHKKNWPSA